MQNLRITARVSRLLLPNKATRVAMRRTSVPWSVLTCYRLSEIPHIDIPHHPAVPVRYLAKLAEAGAKQVDVSEQSNKDSSKPLVKKTEVTYEELVSLIENGSAHLYDVREPTEIRETGSILSAVNIPLTKLKSSLQLNAAQFRANFNDARPPMDDPNIIFYGFGSVKSMAAVEIARKLGFKRARHFPGGWEKWSQEQPKKKKT